MRLIIASVGKLKDNAERTLFARYQDRISGIGGTLGISAIEVREFSESRAKSASVRKRHEAKDLQAVANNAAVKVVLDETGTAMTSKAFATWLAKTRDDGAQSMVFLIGGPDGHDATIRGAATKTLSLSGFTLPHGLARIILMEQIYRALTILAHHPYHRD